MRKIPAIAAARGRLWPEVALILLLIAVMMLAPGAASAQQSTGANLLFGPSSGLISPQSITRGEIFGPGAAQQTPQWPGSPQKPAPEFRR